MPSPKPPHVPHTSGSGRSLGQKAANAADKIDKGQQKVNDWLDKGGNLADKVSETAGKVSDTAGKFGDAYHKTTDALGKARDTFNDVTGRGGHSGDPTSTSPQSASPATTSHQSTSPNATSPQSASPSSTAPQSASTGQGTVDSVVSGIQSVAGDVQGVCGEVSSFAGGAMQILQDPLNNLISAGLGFLIDWCTPIKDALQVVTGDPAALNGAAQTYHGIAEEVRGLADEFQRTVDNGLHSWEGEASQAARAKLGRFLEGIRGTAIGADHVGTLLEASATLMQAALDIIKGILADLIEWLIITWLAAQAAAIPTLGASEVAAGAATAVEVSVTTARAATKVSKVAQLISKIQHVISKIKSAIQALQKTVGTVVKESKAVSKFVESNKKSFKQFGKDELGKVKDAGKDLYSQEKGYYDQWKQEGSTSSKDVNSNLSAF